jgi:hypothetical protein
MRKFSSYGICHRVVWYAFAGDYCLHLQTNPTPLLCGLTEWLYVSEELNEVWKCGRKPSSPTSSFYTGITLERLRNFMKGCSQDSRCRCWDSNKALLNTSQKLHTLSQTVRCACYCFLDHYHHIIVRWPPPFASIRCECVKKNIRIYIFGRLVSWWK